MFKASFWLAVILIGDDVLNVSTNKKTYYFTSINSHPFCSFSGTTHPKYHNYSITFYCVSTIPASGEAGVSVNLMNAFTDSSLVWLFPSVSCALEMAGASLSASASDFPMASVAVSLDCPSASGSVSLKAKHRKKFVSPNQLFFLRYITILMF
jgi:hypothetical protein